MHGLGAGPLNREDDKSAIALTSFFAHIVAVVGTTTSGATPTASWTSAYSCGVLDHVLERLDHKLHGMFCRREIYF